MQGGKINNMLIPNVTKLPSHKRVDSVEQNGVKQGQDQVDKEEFKKLLDEEIGQINRDHGINLSFHAAKRMKERNLTVDGDEFFKLKEGIEKLRNKGGNDSLIITKNAAYIVDVAGNRIVTAIDKDNMAENVFTKIDSTLILN